MGKIGLRYYAPWACPTRSPAGRAVDTGCPCGCGDDVSLAHSTVWQTAQRHCRRSELGASGNPLMGRQTREMSDPHVESLTYDVRTDDHVQYESPTPLMTRNPLGEFSISEQVLTVRLASHFPTVTAARNAVDAYLRGWEIASDLRSNIGEIRFVYRDAVAVDRNPPPPGTPIVGKLAATLAAVTVSGNATLSLNLNCYPDPPGSFCATPDVTTAYERWMEFREGMEPLQAMAYAVLTLVESRAGGRPAAASALRVSIRVLSNIGQLSSKPGLSSAFRKLDAGAAPGDMPSGHRSWLEAATRLLITRMGEAAGGNDLTEITMDSLPPLEP